jgi:hypothetical protein
MRGAKNGSSITVWTMATRPLTISLEAHPNEANEVRSTKYNLLLRALLRRLSQRDHIIHFFRVQFLSQSLNNSDC